ncbi:hypothetical protein [uncultured Ruegeria sp.]|uniref:hypothetical protein n=1 Tax=uncultured Ruegeria sp. TaxID=259304 RepID=UPI0026390FB8|nr:hypothetical protein [uncultured Ruegeria sp.]
MRRISLSGVVIGAALLAACGSGAQVTSDQPVVAERQECEANGGRYELGGRARQPICFTPLPDAGAACEKASDCAGFCLSETKQCSAVTPQFGCIPHLDEAGRTLVICID